MSIELKHRYAQRSLQSPHIHNKECLKSYAKNPKETKDSYILGFKENQPIKIEAIKSSFAMDKSPLEHVKPATKPDASWGEMKQKAVKIGKADTTSNKFGIRDQHWKLIQESKRKVRRDYELNVNSPEFQDLELFVKIMRVVGADIRYIGIPSNGVWYDHIGTDKERRQAAYKKVHSTIVDNDGKTYDMTDKEYEKYVISDAVHIGWKGWVYMDEQIAEHTKGESRSEADKPKN